MSRFGPSPGELRFRLIAGLAGLALTAAAALYIRATTGAHLGELLVVSVGYFGGTAAHAGWKLYQMNHPPPSE